MGSDRQHLSGHVLAKLYEDISLGPTFVPLRGPPNRWEGPDVRTTNVRACLFFSERHLTLPGSFHYTNSA
jgi:hypothetical protein